MATRFKGTAAETRALNAFIALSRASESVAGKLQQPLAESGMTQTQLGVLEALLHLGPLIQCELARRLLRSPANITAVLDTLERRKWVRRERGGDDRRTLTIHLTSEGRDRIEKAFPSHVAGITALLGALTLAEQEELTRLCRKLGLAAARPGSEVIHSAGFARSSQ